MQTQPKKIFEDDDIAVLSKPYGLVVNKADTTKGVQTLQDWAFENIKLKVETKDSNSENDFLKRYGIVHRLDKDTSGIILLAKNFDAFSSLSSQFKQRLVQKTYLALVHGVVDPAGGIINAPIERNPFNRKRFGVFPGGRESITEYTTMTTGELVVSKILTKFTLLKLYPKTGRTHQIRVHLKHLGFPIVSDLLYGGRKNVRSDLVFCPRMFLHAFKISFTHPVSGQKLIFQSDLPSDLIQVLSRVGIKSSLIF